MTTKYTPGPWKVVKIKFQGDIEDTLFVCPTGMYEFNIAQVFNSIGVDNQANAELIASAPETAAERDRLKEENEKLKLSLSESQKSRATDKDWHTTTLNNYSSKSNTKIEKLQSLNKELVEDLKRIHKIWRISKSLRCSIKMRVLIIG